MTNKNIMFDVVGLAVLLGQKSYAYAYSVDENSLTISYCRTVSEKPGALPGYRVYDGDKHIGWVANSFVPDLKEIIGEKTDKLPVAFIKAIAQANGYPKLICKLRCESDDRTEYVSPPSDKSTQLSLPPEKEKPQMKIPSFQELFAANASAATNAAKLELGAIANDRLAKIIAKRVPDKYSTLLKTSPGHLLLANAALVGSKAVYPDNKTLGSLTQAMVVSGYQEILKDLDIPGILDELLEDKEIAKALKQVEKEADA